MSQHASLRIDPTRTKHRNVLKRYERIRRLQEMQKWNHRPSALGLPKVKSLKIKVKKIKEAKAEGATAATAAAPQAAASKGATPAKGAVPAKAAPAAKAAAPKASETKK